MSKKYFFTACLIIFISGCSTLSRYADVREPSVRFSDMSIQSISFDGVTLLFDFDVTNPNQFGVSAEEYSYEFFINERSFLTGRQTDKISIDREQTTTIQVPVSMRFLEVAETFGSVLRQDSLSYQLATKVSFDMPALGSREVPVETSGQFPIPKIPRIEFGEFNVNSMSFSGAEVEVSFHINNPNPFGISLNRASYVLDVNGNEWLDSTLEERIEVRGSERKTVTIPLQLSTSQLGTAMLSILSGNQAFDYELTGTAEISADLEGFEDYEVIPFDLQGSYRLD